MAQIVLDTLLGHFKNGEILQTGSQHGNEWALIRRDAWLQVAPFEIERVCEYLKTTPGLSFDYLECITGVDYPDLQKIVVVYHIYSYTERHRVILKAFLDRADPAMPSIVNVWSTAN